MPSTDNNEYNRKESRIIRYIEDNNMTHYVINYNISGSMILKTRSSIVNETGFILNEINLKNYRGYIINNETIVDDEVLYR